MQRSVHSKSIFQSKTFWGVILAAIGGIAPLAAQLATEREETGRWNWDNAAAIVVIVTGAGGAIVGRVQADSRVYTPDGLPGPNQDDLPGGRQP